MIVGIRADRLRKGRDRSFACLGRRLRRVSNSRSHSQPAVGSEHCAWLRLHTVQLRQEICSNAKRPCDQCERERAGDMRANLT